MAGSAPVAWWWESLAGEQRWCGHADESPPPGSPPDGWAFATVALDEHDLWWVEPVTGGIPRTTRAIPGSALPVSAPCRDDHARIDGARAALGAADLARDARVLEVRGADDWARLVTSHPRRMQRAGAEWSTWTGWAGTWRQPDWASVAGAWDGVHVTVGAYLEGAYRPLPVGAGMTILAGWNPDETVWLGPGIGGYRPVTTAPGRSRG